MKPSGLIDIHPLLADRVRLSIMIAVAASERRIDFSTLLQTLNISRGNLSSHITKLEKAGLVKVMKEFVNRKPRTSYSSTPQGRKEIKQYLITVEKTLLSLKE